MTVASVRRERASAPGLDLLAVPVLGALLLRRRWLQWPLLLLSAVLVLHGLLGPSLAPKNLATLLVWVHWRGLLVLALLVLGNVFCLACPFVLVRDGLRRLRTPRLPWPRALRGKYVGIALLVAVLYCYEWLDLWGSPPATAALILGYYGAVLLVDGLFQGAPFCKSVCPIGQFNFAASALSPFEVRPASTAVCDDCSGHECLRGVREPIAPALATAGGTAGATALATAGAPLPPARMLARGCELGLLLPEKHGNMDCTFCLDCVRACPEDNVLLAPRLPGDELHEDVSGSGVGRRSRRPDLALLAVVFSFGALLNAFGMVSPVYAVQQWMADALGVHSESVVLALLFGLVLVLEPVLLLGAAAALSRRALPRRELLPVVVVRFAPCLVPLGFGVWIAHYLFHFLTGLWTFVPVAQKALIDLLGTPLLGAPRWGAGGLTVRTVQPIEMGLLLLGAMGSLSVAWQIARREAPTRTAAAFWPWGTVVLMLAGAAVWLLQQPMEMRGTFLT